MRSDKRLGVSNVTHNFPVHISHFAEMKSVRAPLAKVAIRSVHLVDRVPNPKPCGCRLIQREHPIRG